MSAALDQYPDKWRVCLTCREDLPWSEFRAKLRWPDGQVRTVLSHCRGCQRARDAIRHARAKGRRPGTGYHPNAGPRVPPKPVQDFLLVLQGRGMSHVDIEIATGVPARRVWAILNGEPEHVTLDTADRLLLPFGYSVTAICGRPEYDEVMGRKAVAA